MTTLREAAQQALEALNGSQYRMNQYGYQAMETTIAANSEAITALRTALAQEQTLEQEPSNPKEKEMNDPNSISFNLNTDALPVECFRLDGSGFRYKGKVIEDAGEAYDLFKQWLSMAHQRAQPQPLTSAKDRPGAIYVEGYGFVDERAVRAVEAEVLKRVGVQR